MRSPAETGQGGSRGEFFRFLVCPEGLLLATQLQEDVAQVGEDLGRGLGRIGHETQRLEASLQVADPPMVFQNLLPFPFLPLANQGRAQAEEGPLMVRLSCQHLAESLRGAGRVSRLEIQTPQMKESVRIAGLEGEGPLQVVARLGVLTEVDVGNAETQLQFPSAHSQLPGLPEAVESPGVIPQDGVADAGLVVGLRVGIGTPERRLQVGQRSHVVFADGDLSEGALQQRIRLSGNPLEEKKHPPGRREDQTHAIRAP